MGITYLPSQHTDSNPGHKYEFSLKVILVQSEQQAKFYFKKKKKKVNSRLLGGTLPQLWDGFICYQ